MYYFRSTPSLKVILIPQIREVSFYAAFLEQLHRGNDFSDYLFWKIFVLKHSVCFPLSLNFPKQPILRTCLSVSFCIDSTLCTDFYVPSLSMPKCEISVTFLIKQKVSNEPNLICRSNVQSTDRISKSNFELNYSLEMNIWSKHRIGFRRLNIQSAH